MVCLDLGTKRGLEELYPLPVHRIVINGLSRLRDRLSEASPPTKTGVEQESGGAQLAQGIAPAGPAQEWDPDPGAAPAPVLAGQRPPPRRDFTPRCRCIRL